MNNILYLCYLLIKHLAVRLMLFIPFSAKVYYHGTTEVGGQSQPNPPPYSVYPHSPPPHTQQPGGYGPTVVQATVVSGVVPVMVTHQMGPSPARLTCKSCNFEIVTRVETKPTMRTHLFAALLCLLG